MTFRKRASAGGPLPCREDADPEASLPDTLVRMSAEEYRRPGCRETDLVQDLVHHGVSEVRGRDDRDDPLQDVMVRREPWGREGLLHRLERAVLPLPGPPAKAPPRLPPENARQRRRVRPGPRPGRVPQGADHNRPEDLERTQQRELWGELQQLVVRERDDAVDLLGKEVEGLPRGLAAVQALRGERGRDEGDRRGAEDPGDAAHQGSGGASRLPPEAPERPEDDVVQAP